MAKTKKELLDDYDTRAIKWCLENGTLADYYDALHIGWRERRRHRASQPSPTPWPLTEEEDADRAALYQELEEAAKATEPAKQLLFFRCGGGHRIKFVK